MQRFSLPARHNWQAVVESQGLVHHSHWLAHEPEGGTLPVRKPYWYEDAFYRISMAEADLIDIATARVNELCLEAVEHVVRHRLFDLFRIPADYHDCIAWSWQQQEPTLYGRMDFAWDGHSAPKLMEFNADTPTTVLETSVIQWLWREDRVAAGLIPAGCDQFNSLHEKLIERFGELRRRMPEQAVLYFAALPVDEDVMTVEYLRDCASQAGLQTDYIQLDHICESHAGRLCDPSGNNIDFLFKLYPWEWIFTDPYGHHARRGQTGFLEPVWRCLLSNKAILPLLWQMFPGHENLLPASFSPLNLPFQVCKPILGREGANVSIIGPGGNIASLGGTYGQEGFVYQGYAPLWQQGGIHTMIGSWIVGDMPAGICIRENDGPIIDNLSRLVPHIISGS